MANPALGIHNISGYIGATSYTSSTGFNSQASGSAFLAVVGVASNTLPALSDTFTNTYVKPALTSGTNPIQEVNDGSPWLFTFVCLAGAGGANHELTVTCTDTLRNVQFIEIKNASAIDVSGSGYIASASSGLSIPVTTAAANDVIVSVASNGGGSPVTITPGGGSGFTALDSVSAVVSMASAYVSGASISTYNAEMTVSGQALVGVTLAFSGSGVAPPAVSYYLGSSNFF